MSKNNSAIELRLSRNCKYKIAYGIAASVVFSLAKFISPVAAQIKNSNEMPFINLI